jgi:restriction endonuclease S subunit
MTEVLSEKPILFSVGLDMLADRFDPMYYHPKYMSLIKLLKQTNFEVKSFGEISELITDMGAFSLYNVEHFVKEGIPFIRVQNIKEGELDLTDLKYINGDYHNKLKKSQLKPNDILLTTKGTIGVATVVPENLGEANISQNLVRIVVKEYISPMFVSTFLNSDFGRIQTERGSTGNIQKYLNFQKIRSIEIPIPPRPIQDKIASIMQNAYEERKESLQRAAELLNSIDDLILDELGIEIPKAKAKWYYSIKRGDIEDRLDAEFYNPNYITTIKALKRSKYGFSNLKEISKQITRGVEVGSGEYKEDGVPFLRVQNIQKYEINFDDCVFISEEVYNNLKRYKIEPNDVLFTKDGTIGLSTLVPEGIQDCIISSGISRIKLNENVNPKYVVAVLNTDFLRLQAERKSYGSVIVHFSLSELERLKTPLPPLEIQNKMANEIENRREETKNLIIRAETVIGEAKKRVERMILGKNRGNT